jgi:hypothetical protein
MAEFVLINQHDADEHAELMEEYGRMKDDLPPQVKGQVQYCTCPGGEHGGYFMVEADSAESALAMLDSLPKLKAGTRAVSGMRFSI